MAGTVDAGLLERGQEIAAFDRFLEEVLRGAGAALLIAGEPGIGKSSLLESLLERGAAARVRCCFARASELEAELAFGVVRRLFEPAVARLGAAGRAQVLGGVAQRARPILEAADNGDAGPPESAMHALYWLTANLAEDGPLVLAVDDTHWADRSSLRFLAYLARRIRDVPVLLVMSTRGQPEDAPQALGVEQPDAVLAPGSLSQAAVSALVAGGLGTRADEGFAAACRTATGGNPFLVRALVRELAAADIAPVDQAAERVPDMAPAVVGRWVLDRLGGLPSSAAALARAVAVLGESAEYRHVVALAGLDEGRAAAAIAALAGAQILEDARPLRFTHPIVRGAVYRDLPLVERAGAHGRAARLLAAEGAAPELIATQLLGSEALGDANTVTALAAAAARAMSRGAPDAAARYLRRALEEPPPLDQRADLLLQLGLAEARAFDAQATEHLTEAIERSPTAELRARTAEALAGVLALTGRASESVAVLREHAEALREQEPELSLMLAAQELAVSRSVGWPLQAERREELVRMVREAVGEGSRALAGVMAMEVATANRAASEAVALARRALSGGPISSPDSPMGLLAPIALVLADCAEDAHGALTQMLAQAQVAGLPRAFAITSVWRAWAAYRLGRIAGAEADARAGFNVLVQEGERFTRPAAAAFLVLPLLERGEAEAAEEVAARVGNVPPTLNGTLFLYARGRLRLEQGDPAAALEDMLDCGRRFEAAAIVSPAVAPWRSTAAAAMHALGDRDEALRLAREELELARAFGAARTVGVALRGLGAVADDGREPLREAVAVLEGSEAVLERAAALADLGAALRSANQCADAREPLRQAIDLALSCRATALAHRAQEELKATGAKPRRLRMTQVDALTPSELRICRLAAEGRSNREIAQALFVSRKNVEMHLYRAYRKLGISSRQELEGALRRGEQRESPEEVGTR